MEPGTCVAPSPAVFPGPWCFLTLPPITPGMCDTPATGRRLLSGVHIATHTLLLKQSPMDRGAPCFRALLEGRPSCCCSPHICPQRRASSSPGPVSLWAVPGGVHVLLLGRQPQLHLGARILKTMAWVHSEPVRQESAFFHQQMIKGELPDSVLAGEGTMDSEVPKLGRQRQWAGLRTSGLGPGRRLPQGKDGFGRLRREHGLRGGRCHGGGCLTLHRVKV